MIDAKHVAGEHSWGINGDITKIVDMKAYDLYKSVKVKVASVITAVEAAWMLRVDGVVQAVRKEREQSQQGPSPEG